MLWWLHQSSRKPATLVVGSSQNRQDIQNFCDAANQIKGFVDVVDKYNFVGNAKSLLGVLRLCPSTLTVEVQAEYAEKLKLLCQEWVVK